MLFVSKAMHGTKKGIKVNAFCSLDLKMPSMYVTVALLIVTLILLSIFKKFRAFLSKIINFSGFEINSEGDVYGKSYIKYTQMLLHELTSSYELNGLVLSN